MSGSPKAISGFCQHSCSSRSSRNENPRAGDPAAIASTFDWGFNATSLSSSVSFSSLSTTSSCSSLGEVPSSHLTALVEGLTGVMSSVKTLSRHPVLATVLWLLGGEVDRSKEFSAASSKTTSTNHSQKDEIRRLRWNAPIAPEAKCGDRIVYYVDKREGSSSSLTDAPSKDSSSSKYHHRHNNNHHHQVMYPETIAVERITHMDRLEEDDLDPSPQSSNSNSSSLNNVGGGLGHEDVISPQWGWYVTLTPPKPEFNGSQQQKDSRGRKHHHHHHHHHHYPRSSDLRPALT